MQAFNAVVSSCDQLRPDEDTTNIKYKFFTYKEYYNFYAIKKL
jgi:hypothetical protein